MTKLLEVLTSEINEYLAKFGRFSIKLRQLKCKDGDIEGMIRINLFGYGNALIDSDACSDLLLLYTVSKMCDAHIPWIQIEDLETVIANTMYQHSKGLL